MKHYNLGVCGGTFDLLHKGHKEFISFALLECKKILIGLTTDAYIQKQKTKEDTEPYEYRKKKLEEYVSLIHAKDRVSIQPIDDVYIPKIWEMLPIDTIIVSKDTLQGAEIINKKRTAQKLFPLPILILPITVSSNGQPLSTSRIRNGEVSSEGTSYVKDTWLSHTLKLPLDLRAELKSPFGELITNPSNWFKTNTGILNQPIITVGDGVTSYFLKQGIVPKISVIDLHIGRKKMFSTVKELGFTGQEKVIKVNNPAGYITPSLFQAAVNLFKTKNSEPTVLLVNGEEDLAVLPLLLVAPLGYYIFYGQPGVGVVITEVSEITKNKAYAITLRLGVQ